MPDDVFRVGPLREDEQQSGHRGGWREPEQQAPFPAIAQVCLARQRPVPLDQTDDAEDGGDEEEKGFIAVEVPVPHFFSCGEYNALSAATYDNCTEEF